MKDKIIILDEQGIFDILDAFQKHYNIKKPTEKIWLTGEEVMKMLNIKSKTTLIALKEELEYSQISRKIILYKRESILEFLDKKSNKL